MTEVAGLDASFARLDSAFFVQAKALGHRVFGQDCWAGGYANNADLRDVAEVNLRDAEATGLIPVIYSNANSWWPVATSVAETKANAGAMWGRVRIVTVDAEIAEISEANIYDLAVAFEQEGKKVCIYCGQWVWEREGSPAWSSLSRFPLWTSDTLSHDPSLATARRYGPWVQGQVIGRQYDTDSGLLDREVDLNTFALDFFEEEPMVSLELLTKITEVRKLLDQIEASPWPFGRVLLAIGANNACGALIAQATAEYAKPAP